MLRGIFRKAVADLRGRPLQAALLFLVIVAAAATLSLALNVQASATKPYERLREASNGADAWVYASGPGTQLERLRDFEGVREVGEPYPVSWENYGIRNGETKQQLALVGMRAELPKFDHPVVTKGRWLASGGLSEIVLDAGAANLLDLKVAQEVQLLTEDGNVPFTVVGFAVTASRNPAPISDPAYAYVLRETLQRIEPEAVFGASPTYQLVAGVALVDPEDDASLFFETRTNLGGPAGISRWLDVREDSKEANQFDVIFLNVFSVFALLAAGLIIANAVGGQVLSQMRDIGILKAIGFTPRQVTLSLLFENFALSLVASAVGVVVGLLVAPFFLSKTADLLAVPASAAFNPVLLLIAVAVIAALVAVFTIVPAWRAGSIAAIEALNAGNDQARSGRSRIGAFAGRLHLPPIAVVGLKDLARRPTRTAMTVLALVFAVVTATFSLGIEATLAKTMSDPRVLGGPPYDIFADRDAFPDGEARRILDSNPGIEVYAVLYNTGAAIGNRGFDLRGFEGDLNEPRWAIREGRMPERAGEAAVSTNMAREFGLEVGQRVMIVTGFPRGEAQELVIVGRNLDFEGTVMTVHRDSLPASEEPSDYWIKAKPGEDVRDLADELISQSGGHLDPEVLDKTLADIRADFRSVLIALNAVLFTIAGLNLLSSLLLNIRERRRDFAILKTVGFTPSQVGQAVFWGSAALAVFAVAFGLPVGLIATRVMFDLLSSAAGIGTGVGAMPGVLWLAPLVPGAIAIAALATVIPARRAAAVEVAEVLRYE